MSKNPDSLTNVVTTGGVAAKHPPAVVHDVLVGPSTNGEFNTVELDFAPEACVRFDDVRFEFDSSFIGPEAATELKLLGKLIKEGPERPASIFGHADPVGDDDYNKILSGRRSQAMYGLLTRKTELWEDLFKHPQGGDSWGTQSIQVMLKTLGHYSGPINGTLDTPTRDAVKAFQGSPEGAGLVVDGDPGQSTRPKLYKAYMDRICVDDADQSFQLDPAKNFLAQGADAGGKGDFQGCSEFNPDLVFSQEETNRFKNAANKAERDQENKPNRRVVVYLFRKGSKISPASWPCPRAKEGVAACRKRFFSDGEKRRTPTATRRLFKDTKDTFACRFYDRISTLSPCEGPPPPPPPPPPPVNIVSPLIRLQTTIVIVKKPHTNPQRVPITLQTDTAFAGTGTFTRSGAAIRFFTAAAGGTEITFNGTDNVFTGAQLTPGHQLFAEGATPSAALDDVRLTLTLTPGVVQVGPPANAAMTSVEVTLDICMSRTAVGVDPTPMPQPPAAPPAAGTRATDKFFGGRFVHAQDAGNHHGRAMLIVRQVQPTTFVGNLTLTPTDAKVQLFQNEDPAAAGAALATPQVIASNTIPANGLRFFVQGATVSSALVDSGFQLGIQNVEPDGDKVAVTVVRLKNLQADIPSTPANTNRLGNSPVPRHTLTRAAGALAAADFDEDFAANPPLVLVEGSIVAADQIKLSVQVEPANVPVLWSRQRDTRPAPNGDHPDIIALSPNPLPAVTPDGADPLKATLVAGAVGSFHVRPFVDCNGTGQFEHNDNTGARIDREPFLIMNLVLIRVRGFTNTSLAQQANVRLTPAAPTTATGVGVSTGNFVAPAGAGVHNNAIIDVIGGGGDGLRGLTSLFAGWINNELASAGSPTVPATEDVVSNYRDPAPPNTVHPRISAWVQPPAHALFQVFTPPPPPPPPPPVLTIQGGPVLDCTNHGAEGTGGNTPVGTEGGGRTPGPPTPIVKNPRPAGGGNLGQRWQVEMWDSPGDNCPAAHEGFPAATLTDYRFNLDFRSDLVFWTNITGAPGATGDAACMLYSSVLTNTWTIRFACTFNAAGAAVIGTALTIAMIQDANATRLAIPVQGSGLEVRGPISLRLLIVDARN